MTTYTRGELERRAARYTPLVAATLRELGYSQAAQAMSRHRGATYRILQGVYRRETEKQGAPHERTASLLATVTIL